MLKKIIGKNINSLLGFFDLSIHTASKKSFSKIEKEKKDIIKEVAVENKVIENKNEMEDKFKYEDSWLKNLNFKSILDIGANSGQFVEKFLIFYPKADFFCFEPLSEPFDELKEKFGSKQNFHLYKFALGNKAGEEKIFHNEYSPSSSLLAMKDEHKDAFDFAREEFEEEITIKKLDHLSIEPDIKKPYLVKMDTQGFESEVIKGGKDIISKADMIIIETSFVQLYEGAPLFDDIYMILKNMGFEYVGSFEQLRRPQDGKILQQDSIFIKKV